MERMVRNLVRRMVVTGAGIARWSLRGHGDEHGRFETIEADMYHGIGICARPPEASDTEAVVLAIDAAGHRRVIVAVRDAQTQEALVETVGLGANETLLHNADMILKITNDRQILIGLPGGEFQGVALADHTHAAPEIIGQAQYAEPDARTGPPNSVSEQVKVT